MTFVDVHTIGSRVRPCRAWILDGGEAVERRIRHVEIAAAKLQWPERRIGFNARECCWHCGPHQTRTDIFPVDAVNENAEVATFKQLLWRWRFHFVVKVFLKPIHNILWFPPSIPA